MPFITRLALSAPFVLVLIQYISFVVAVVSDPSINSFWQNNASRESLFAIALAGVALNLIWSTKVTQIKIVLIGVLGAPLILGFWIATLAVGFADAAEFRSTYVMQVAQLVLFIIGFLMVATRS